ESSLGADENSGEIIARSVERFSAEMHERAVGKNNFQSKNMCRCKSVFQAMRAARIFGDVSADAAHRLRRWIGRVEILVRQNAAGDIEIYYAGLDDDACIR